MRQLRGIDVILNLPFLFDANDMYYELHSVVQNFFGPTSILPIMCSSVLFISALKLLLAIKQSLNTPLYSSLSRSRNSNEHTTRERHNSSNISVPSLFLFNSPRKNEVCESPLLTNTGIILLRKYCVSFYLRLRSSSLRETSCYIKWIK